MAEMMGSALAELWCESNGQAAVQSIMAINRQGLLLGYELARALNVRLLYIEKESSGTLVIKQGIRLIPDEKTLLVCDILTEHINLTEITDFIKKSRAAAMGLISLAEINIREAGALPHRTLARFSFGDYDPAECPLCKANFPLEKPEE